MCAVPIMAVFCNSLLACFPSILLRYFLNESEMVPVSLAIIGITFYFTFHMHHISFVRSLNFKIFKIFITNLSPEFAVSVNMHVPSSLSRTVMSSLLLGTILSGFTCWFHGMVPLFSWLVSTDFVTCFYLCLFLHFTLISLHLVAHTVSCLYMYCSLPAHIGHADTLWYVVSSYCWHSQHLLSLFVIYVHMAWYLVCIFVVVVIVVSCHRSFLASTSVLLLNQRWCPLLRLQVSDCSTCCIVHDVPSVAFLLYWIYWMFSWYGFLILP